MIRRFIRSVLHNATVTAADAAWPVSLRIDPVLMRAMETRPFEEVEIVNTATGDRFTTWIEEGGPGEVRVHGGSAAHVRTGDVISIVSAGWLHDGQTLSHKARVIALDAENHVVSLTED